MEIRVHIAVLVIAADPTHADTATADAVAQKATGAGHAIVARAAVGDDEAAIRTQLAAWIADPEIDVVIAAAEADTRHAPAALKPLVHEAVPGFTDLFRWLAFQEIGASAMLASAEAARCGTTFVFVLPAAAGAVATAMDKLILPQLDLRTTPRNLVAQMPRLRSAVAAAPAAADAVPTAVSMERTESGPGLSPRLPAPHVVRKEPAAKPAPKTEEKTRIISTDQLESKIRQSNEHDAVTKPGVEIANLLPRVPPGADELDDDGELGGLTEVISPQPFARAKTPTQKGTKKPTTVQIPARGLAQPGAPVGAIKKDESGRVAIPAKQPSVIPIAKMAKAAGMALKHSQPADEAPTVPRRASAKLDDASAKADEAPATLDEAPTQRTAPAPAAPVPIAATGSARVAAAAEPDVSASGSRPMTLDESQLEEIDETPTPKRLAATTPPPTPIIAEIRARHREPTPLPLLPKRSDNDLPQGKFIYATHKSRTGRRIAIFLALAVLAAAAGIAFVRFVLTTPSRAPTHELAIAPPVPADATEAPEVAPAPPQDADIPEIEIEIPVGSAELPRPVAGTHRHLPNPNPNPNPNPTPTPTPNPNPTPTPTPTPNPASVDAGVAAVPVPIDAGPPIEDGCDEVTCVTNHYEKACCARWKPAADSFRPHTGLAEGLDKVMVREAIENVKPRVIACGEQNAAKGIVKLALVVGADGTVKSVEVVETPLPALGSCVAAAVKEAQFAKTAKGGSFNYPFAF